MNSVGSNWKNPCEEIAGEHLYFVVLLTGYHDVGDPTPPQRFRNGDLSPTCAQASPKPRIVLDEIKPFRKVENGSIRGHGNAGAWMARAALNVSKQRDEDKDFFICLEYCGCIQL